MKAKLGLFWRWLRYRFTRIIPDVLDPVALSRRSIHGRRHRVEQALDRVRRTG